jgi:hypothetical protein
MVGMKRERERRWGGRGTEGGKNKKGVRELRLPGRTEGIDCGSPKDPTK